MGQKIFAFCNQKGGVGKTTTVINLAACVANAGATVLVVDCDQQGNATSGFGVDKNAIEKTLYDCIGGHEDVRTCIIKNVVSGVDLVPSNANLAGAEVDLLQVDRREFVLKGIIDSIKNDYDYIFIDCPPSLGLLTINALVSAEALMIPLQCEYYSLEGLGQLVDTYTLIKERLNDQIELFGVVLTMADFRTNLTSQVIGEVKNYFKEKVFSSIIPRSVKLSEAPGFGKPATIYAPQSPGTLQYKALAKEFLERLEFVAKPKQQESVPSSIQA